MKVLAKRFSLILFAATMIPAALFGQCRQRSMQPMSPDASPASSVKIHVFYALASDSIDRHLDTNCTISKELSVIQNYVAGQYSGSQLRFRTWHSVPDITYIRLSATQAQYAAYDNASALLMTRRIEAELNLTGYCQPGEFCLLYYEGSSPYECGDVASPDAMGNTGVLILHGTPPGTIPCDANPFVTSGTAPLAYWGAAALHETIHGMKFVQDGAPNTCGDGTGHVNIPNDIMFGCGGIWGNPKTLVMDHAHINYFLSGRPYDLSHSAIWQPLPSHTQLPMGWPYGTLACKGTNTAGLKSPTQQIYVPTQIWLINNENRQVYIYWVDYSGNDELMKILDPKDEFIEDTYVSQPWVIKTAKGQVLAVYLPTATFSQAIIR